MTLGVDDPSAGVASAYEDDMGLAGRVDIKGDRTGAPHSQHLGIQNASKKWTMPIQNWNLTLSQLAIFFEGRFDTALDL